MRPYPGRTWIRPWSFERVLTHCIDPQAAARQESGLPAREAWGQEPCSRPCANTLIQALCPKLRSREVLLWLTPDLLLCRCEYMNWLFSLKVQIPGSLPSQGPALSGHTPSASGPTQSPVLQPRTLILTSTDVFLLDEDYVSYPLPDFAKEPPSRWAHRLPLVSVLEALHLFYSLWNQRKAIAFQNIFSQVL